MKVKRGQLLNVKNNDLWLRLAVEGQDGVLQKKEACELLN